MGGVYVVADLRGGGEYGKNWHLGGSLLNKQNVFDDFIATAEWLIENNYTSREKLAIQGGSNGGLLVGACMTQRPDLFAAALPAVGVLDMLRYHKFTIGWAWIPEYGSSEDEDMFPFLFGYSPYHNLKEGTSYPATLITTGDHDDRVVPAHSFKFAAALQYAQKGENPTLIRIETDAGHGAGTPTSKRIDYAADIHTFLYKELGMTWQYTKNWACHAFLQIVTTMDHRTATIALNMLPRIGPVLVKRLLERFSSAENILLASHSELTTVSGIGAETAKILTEWQTYAHPIAEIEEAEQRGIKIILATDEDFPEPLKQLYACPLLLYVWGNIQPPDNDSIAVVGTRRCTHYGLQTTKKLSYQLASAGLTIISGLARGIDTAAHEGALAAKGRTIGVIGSGLGQLYPPENLGLAQKIAEGNGAIVTEFPLNTTPDRKTFPQRNRIVAGWCRGLLVTECPKRSGSLITATQASEAGKNLYAVPGQIDRPTSAGCHDLIRDGATLVTDGSEILDDLSVLKLDNPKEAPAKKTEPTFDLTAEQRLIYDQLSSSELNIDQLVDLTELTLDKILPNLLALELKNLAKSLPGSFYVKG